MQDWGDELMLLDKIVEVIRYSIDGNISSEEEPDEEKNVC
jgi:hypothetical protein